MAYEWMVTADWHDTDVFTALSGSVSRSNVVARTGSWSFRLNNGEAVTLGVADNATKYYGLGFYATTANDLALDIRIREGSTTHTRIYVNTNAGRIEARSEGGTLIGSGGTITTNRYYYLGVKTTVDDSSGIIQANLDGAEIFNLTSKDTRNAATGTIDNILVISNIGFSYIDDIKVRDDAIPGVGGIYVYVPTGDGGDVAWTGSAGNDWECVDDAPGTYTDYISTDAATTGTKSTFTHAAMAGSAYDSIPCVCAAAVAKLDGVGAGNVRAIVESNGSYGNGASTALSTVTKYMHVFCTVNPDGGGAWDKTAVGAAEPGVETI